jgi:hypothetical protein
LSVSIIDLCGDFVISKVSKSYTRGSGEEGKVEKEAGGGKREGGERRTGRKGKKGVEGRFRL